MSNDVTALSSDLVIAATAELEIHRDPGIVLAEAQKAAAALKDVISRKARPVKFNGEQYLEFEDWQTVGRFYGISARVREVRPVEFGDIRGFEATADALHAATGQVISSATSMCLNEEANWARKPLFQLMSMAQSRACAKVLRNVLSWVVVLAGYRATPAEEMQDDRGDGRRPVVRQAPAPPPAPQAHRVSHPPELQRVLDGMKDKPTINTALDQLRGELAEKLGDEAAEAEFKALLTKHGATRWEDLHTPKKAKLFAADVYEVIRAAPDPLEADLAELVQSQEPSYAE